ncbi:hypothetical protein V9T20_12940 (plasmid) [Halobacterium salinarum]|jgi:hypothetical protein|uniref:hypothetical protein n=1 Tax=Halobacterium salinarum TaxID=2242 RepID=UPI0030D498B8
MSWTVVAGGLLALKALDELLSETDADHNDVLRDAYEHVEQATTEKASIYVDHLNVDADGNPRDATPGDDHVPDLVVSQYHGQSLVIEVETGDTLDGSAKSQLEDFKTPSYKRVLVVPDAAVSDGTAFLEEFQGDEQVVVCGPSDLAAYL